MDFFSNQIEAHKKTKLLIVLFALAVISIICLIHFAAILLIPSTLLSSETVSPAEKLATIWNPTIFSYSAIITLLIITVGSIYKTVVLRGGGKTVATTLGGKLVSSDAVAPLERRLLNIVEEMSIASGLPVPPVYLMPNESSINAFAAGYSPRDAVIGVTKGCIEKLTRAELQGVIAHEFSHILNGDMRLNIKLIGIVHGILVIAIIGSGLMRASSRGRSRDNDGASLAVVGIALYAIGYIGVFFGKLIKSAVSRQREFLADASAVQYTRNSDGISGALKKIGGFSLGSYIHNSHSEEISHMFFSSGLNSCFSNLLSTHPPLATRIKRIDPYFEYAFPNTDSFSAYENSKTNEKLTSSFHSNHPEVLSSTDNELINSIGKLDQSGIDYATKIISTLPLGIASSIHTQIGAEAVVLSLLLENEEQIDNQLKIIAKNTTPEVTKQISRIMHDVKELERHKKLPLVEMCLPVLSSLTIDDYNSLISTIHQLIKLDKRISLFEFAVKEIIEENLKQIFHQVNREGPKYNNLIQVEDEVNNILSLIAYSGYILPNGDYDIKEATAGHQLAVNSISLDASINTPDKLTSVQFSSSIKKIDKLAPAAKKSFISACIACISNDGVVTNPESELLRVISTCINVPIPPLHPS